LVATNPVDIITYATWKFSGLPKERVIGSGTVLDSARYRYLLGNEFDTAPSSIHGYIIGEYGDSQVSVWSLANISGTQVAPKLTEQRKNEISEQLRDAAYKIIESKGATYYGIAMGLARITRAILKNENGVLPVGALLNGENGQEDIYIGVPSVVNHKGVKNIVELTLDPNEKEKLTTSIHTLKEIQSQIWK